MTHVLSNPHSLSLKVLRLSRPSLTTQTALPHTGFGHGVDIPANASLAYPSADADSSFPLTPLLTLPAAFGAAYVGETFACTLCVNNELGVTDESRNTVSGVTISAELQTPNQQESIPLELDHVLKDDHDERADLAPAATLQRTLKHSLKEPGTHVLAVTIAYTETSYTRVGEASGGRARTFRKLYQFVAQQLLAVRSKVTERKIKEKGGLRQWVLEAQLENVGESSIVVEKVWTNEREGIESSSVNGAEDKDGVVLKPQDVEQVMFTLFERAHSDDPTSRMPLAQLNIDWRGAMGERGSLTTGWLTTRGR